MKVLFTLKLNVLNFLKKQKKGIPITWSDSNDESEEETANKVMAFIGKYKFTSESSNEEINDEELAFKRKLLYTQWKEACMVRKK